MFTCLSKFENPFENHLDMETDNFKHGYLARKMSLTYSITRNKDLDPEYIIPSIGYDMKDSHVNRIFDNFNIVCVDVANAHTQRMIDYCTTLKRKYSEKAIIIGNLASCDSTLIQKYIDAGVSGFKIGIGSGSMCTTRLQTGIGVPQFTLIRNFVEALKYYPDHLIISDGGIQTPGDIVKAFGAGANIVMVGSMFAGFKDNSVADADGNVEIYGMSSNFASKQLDIKNHDHNVSEGKVVQIPQKQITLKEFTSEIKNCIRSACTYVGANYIGELSGKCNFIKVNQQYNNSYDKYTIGD
jgi:GMP reductase